MSGVRQGRWWTVLSAGWLHGGALHILFNMMWVRQLGPAVEDMYGGARMVIIYTIVVGRRVPPELRSLAYYCRDSVLLRRRLHARRVGADLRAARRAGALRPPRRQQPGRARRRMSYAITMGVFGLIMPGIDNAAHLGGFVGGYLASMWLDPLKPERMDHFIGAAVCLVATARRHRRPHLVLTALLLDILLTADAQTCRPHHRGRRRNRPRPDRSSRRARRSPDRHPRRLAGSTPSIAREGRSRDHRLDPRPAAARAAAGRVRGGSDLPSRGAALDALRVHADRGAPGQRRGHAEPARVRAARGRIARPARSSSSTRRRSPPTGCRTSATKDARRQGHAKTSTCTRRRCTAATSCIASCWATTTRGTTSSSRPRPASGKVDFRCVRFPGLISALTVPSGGTSDYAPEMIHAAAKGEPYACFVRPDTRIPFMAMPDGVEALLTLAAAPRARLQRTAYNVGAFNPSAEEVRDVVMRGVPRRADRPGRPTRSARRSSTRGRPTSTTRAARRDWGFAPRYDFDARVQRVPDPDDPASATR